MADYKGSMRQYQVNALLTSLAIGVLTALFSTACAEWKNDYDKPLNFKCDPGCYISEIKSVFASYYKDRRFDIKCKNATFVSRTCSTTDNYVNDYDGPVDYQCPNSGILVGIESIHNDYYEDRRWKFHCCKKVSPKPTICKTQSTNRNIYEWQYEVPHGFAITSLISFHSDVLEDRFWQFRICTFVECMADKIKILDKFKPEKKGRSFVGLNTGQTCSSEKATLTLSHTEDLLESASFAISNSESFSWGTSMSVSATAKAGFLGNGGEVSMSAGFSTESTTSFGTSSTKQWAKTTGSAHLYSQEYKGPGAAIVFGETDRYLVDKSKVNVEVSVKCKNGKNFKEKQVIEYSSHTYSKAYFESLSGKFNAGVCGSSTRACLKQINADDLQTPNELVESFEKCFANGKGEVTYNSLKKRKKMIMEKYIKVKNIKE